MAGTRRDCTQEAEEEVSEKCCETCRYWEPIVGGDKSGKVRRGVLRSGKCRRHPPQFNPVSADWISRYPVYSKAYPFAAAEAAESVTQCWSFPVISPDEWCGEYAPAPTGAGSPQI